MQDVSGFLKRFSHLLQKKENATALIIEVCEECVGITLRKEQLRLKGTILNTTVTGAEKSQLFISKERLIKEINKRSGKIVLTQIR